jgi:hypothetical protein
VQRFIDDFGSLVIAAFLGMGIGFAIYGARLLRRGGGGAVTAAEAVRWRRAVRKQGFDASPDMPPSITDSLVRAWRTTRDWYYLGLGSRIRVNPAVGRNRFRRLLCAQPRTSPAARLAVFHRY